ncbi:MAG TPA: Crp/Fnr family transcriptional regulator [Nitrospira sp.]|nr:Crp/Fnr family transcriptional regulator [Nitrospira sp.]
MHELVLQNPIFRMLSEEALLKLLSESKLKTFQPDELLISEGVFNPFLYLLTQGTVHVIANDEIVAGLSVGDVVGEISTLGMSTPVADVVAMDTVKAIAFPIEKINDLGLEYPDFAEQLRALSSERIY